MHFDVTSALRQLHHPPVRGTGIPTNVAAGYFPHVRWYAFCKSQGYRISGVFRFHSCIVSPVTICSTPKRRPHVGDEGVRVLGRFWREH